MTLDIEVRSSGPDHEPRRIRYVSAAVVQILAHALMMTRAERPRDGVVVIIRRAA